MTKKIDASEPRTGYGYWINKGFLPTEAMAFMEYTVDAVDRSPALQRLIKSRNQLLGMKKTYGWRTIYWAVLRQYKRKGIESHGKDYLEPNENGIYDARDLQNAFKKNPLTGKIDETPTTKKPGRKITTDDSHIINVKIKIKNAEEDLKVYKRMLKNAITDAGREIERTKINNKMIEIAKLKGQL